MAKSAPAVQHFAGTQTVTLSSPRWLPSLATLAALLVGLLIWTEDAHARFQSGLSFGAADVGTLLPPPADLAAFEGWLEPSVAQPTYPGGSLGGLFNRPGLLGGFAAGFLGSGLVGLLFGHGVIDEISGVAAVLGLAFQLALIVMLARLIWTWWHDDKAKAFAALSPRQLADAYRRPRNEAWPDIDAAAADTAPDAPLDASVTHREPSPL
jgi:hypothetical protein